MIYIDTAYITLTQFLKLADIITNGGAAKAFLLKNELKVNGEKEVRRGRKLYPGDIVTWQNHKYQIAER